MPSFDYIASNHKHGSAMGGGAYSKIFAIFNKQNANTPNSKSTSAQVVLKEGQDYEQILKHADQSGYTQLAGTDLSSIFYPFETSIGASGNLPGFDRKAQYKFLPGDDPSGVYVRNFNLMPFHWNPEESGSVYIRSISPSGDGMASTVSGPQYYGDTNEIRDPNSIRSIGLRLPLIGVGWGYSTEGEAFPHQPSGSISQFKGNPSGLQGEGYHVNPKDYIAAPIDFRYDKRRNVWTAGQNGFWAQIIGSASGLDPSGIKPSGTFYSWKEVLPTRSSETTLYPSGANIYVPLSGYSMSANPAFEINKHAIASGTVVWMIRTREDSYHFNYDQDDFFWAVISDNTGAEVSGLYSWAKIVFSNGVPSIPLDAGRNQIRGTRNATLVYPALQQQFVSPSGTGSNTSVRLATGQLVRMTAAGTANNDPNQPRYMIQSDVPIGSLVRTRGMVMQMIDDFGTIGWDYPRFISSAATLFVDGS